MIPSGVAWVTVNTFMSIRFTDFVKDQRPPSEPQTHASPNDFTVLPESFSSTLVKTAAVGILVKMNQLRRHVAQDRSATNADKSLAEMLFLLSSLLATTIGAK